MALTTSLPSPSLAHTKAAPARSPPHHSWHASESAITWPHHPRNSLTPSCPTWGSPLPQLHRLHLNTAACCRHNQRHLNPATTPPFAGMPAIPLHPPSHASQAHIGPATLQLRCVFFTFFLFPIHQTVSGQCYHINVTPISLVWTQAAPSPLQPRRPAATTVAA